MTEEKALTDEQKLSVQIRATDEVEGGVGFSFIMLADTGTLSPPWWSTARDKYLARTWQQCPLFAGAVYNMAAKLATIPPIIEPRDPTMASHRRLAERYTQRLYERSEFGRGWIEFAMKWHADRWCSDNGAFAEVLGDGPADGPIRGPAVGLANLDSQRCTRTGNPQWPVVYLDEKGQKYKLHYTRVVYGSQLPSTRDEMHGVGFCWFSRTLSMAQAIVDDLTFKQEKLGKRPKRAILVGKKVSVDQVIAAFRMADESADNAGLSRMSVLPVVANPNAADVDISLVDLASLPDGFDWKDDVNLGMYTIALTGGFPVRWMWPATVVGATKADAMIQHMATAMSGTAHELGTLQVLLGGSERGMRHETGKFLPPTLRMRFDVQDDWIDEVQAGIQDVRSQRYERNLGDGAVTVRVTREMMLAKGEITEAQFREMELEAGRTQDGLPVDTLFYGDNPYLAGIDPDDFDEAEVQARLVEAKRASVREASQDRKETAREAVAALDWLLTGQEAEAEEPEPEEEGGDGEEDGGTEETPGEERETKAQSELEMELQEALGDALGEFGEEWADDIEAGEEPDYDRFRAVMLGVLVPLLAASFRDSFAEFEAQTGIAFDPAEIGALAVEWARNYGYELVQGLTETTRKIISEATQAYLKGDLTREGLLRMLEPAFGAVRAEMIGITETTRAYTRATLQYRDLLQERYGLKMDAFWETAGDERVCGLCGPLDGQPESVWTVDCPDGPPAHTRCRCGLRLEIS